MQLLKINKKTQENIKFYKQIKNLINTLKFYQQHVNSIQNNKNKIKYTKQTILINMKHKKQQKNNKFNAQQLNSTQNIIIHIISLFIRVYRLIYKIIYSLIIYLSPNNYQKKK